jgi:signal peptide peptidase SppA
MSNLYLVSADDAPNLLNFLTKIAEADASTIAQAKLFAEAQTEKALSKLSAPPGPHILNITGYIHKDPEIEYFGGTSLDLLTKRLNNAANDNSVSQIILNINSPGGSAEGVEVTANLIRSIRAKKPVIAYTDSKIASAAYWLASAASKIYTNGESARVGSIGVATSVINMLSMYEKMGIKVENFSTGKYKLLGSPTEPLTDDGRAKIQASIDTIFSVFTNFIADSRNIPKDTLLKSADGQVFFAKDAEQRGLTDGFLTFQEILMSAEKDAEILKLKQEIQAAMANSAAFEAKIAEQAKIITDKEAEAKVKADEVKAKEDEATKASCNEMYVKAMGRDATEEEKAEFVAASVGMRKTLQTSLETLASSRVEGFQHLKKELATEPNKGQSKLSADAFAMLAAIPTIKKLPS